MNEEKICGICGRRYIGRGEIVLEDSRYAEICPECNRRLYTCVTCINATPQCFFNTDPSPLPKTVQKVIRRGNATAVTYVLNPERQAITCTKCNCYINEQCNQDAVCNEHAYCKNYHIKITS